MLPSSYSPTSTSSPPLHQGAPESVLERCNYIRLSGSGSSTASTRVPLSLAVREQVLATVREWSSGRDTLRCLAMATRDNPPEPRSLNLENSATFADYEVSGVEGEWVSVGVFVFERSSKMVQSEFPLYRN